jgi:dephospho-CoA kinase
MTFILGITGGIASGKTTATKTLESLGVEIVDADIIARNVVSNDYSNNSSALAKIVDHFGPAILLASGELDRARLRDIIFADPTEKRWLENLLHPIVRKQIIQQL